MYKNLPKITAHIFFIVMTFQSYAQSSKLPLSGYYITDSIKHNLENSDEFGSPEHSYSYLNREEKTLTTYKFPKNRTDALDLENKTFQDVFFKNKPTLIWKNETQFNIHIQDTIFNRDVNVYAALTRVEKDDARIIKIKNYIAQKLKQRNLKHSALKKEFLEPSNKPNGFLENIPKTIFGLAKPLNVYKNSHIDKNFNYQMLNLKKDKLIDDSYLYYGIYKDKTNDAYFNGLNLAIIKAEKPFTLQIFVKKLNLEPVTTIFRTEETLLVKDSFGDYIFFSVKKLGDKKYAIAKGISKSFEYSKKQFKLFSSIDKIKNVDALPLKPMFTAPLTKVDSLFTQTVDKAIRDSFKPYIYIGKAHTERKLYVENILSFQDARLILKKESISSLLLSLKEENKMYRLVLQDKNSLVFFDSNTGRYNVFVLKQYKEQTVMLRLIQIGSFFSIDKPLQSAVYFYKNAKKVALKNHTIVESLKPYFNYFESVWMVHNKKENLFIVTKSKNKNIEGVFSITGSYILPFKYNDITYSQERKGFYIETFDIEIIKPKPEDATQLNRIKETNRKRGWSSEDGKIIIAPQYHSIVKLYGENNLAHVYGFNDEEGILDIITKQYVIPFKKHDITHYYTQKRFVISEGYGIKYLANHKGEKKGPFERLNYNNRGEFIGTKNGIETKLLFE